MVELSHIPVVAQGAVADFFERVRVADLLDVLLVSAMIYVAIGWLRGGASRTVVVLVGGGVALVVLARLLNLYLTQMVLEALFAVFVVTFVVLFQGEIRRELDRLVAQGSIRRSARAAAVPETVETIASVAHRLANERTGALIVLRGREPLDGVVEGGTGLDGRVSETLLCSLFNPRSPGHDGAVVVEGERVTRFSAHLPLSSNSASLGERGTRHAAALGLSERSDAAAVVVSEETGGMSVAAGGALIPMRGETELRQWLTDFWRSRLAPQRPGRDRGRQWREAGVVAASVALAAVFWLTFAYQSEVEYQTFRAPIRFRNLPAAHVLSEPVPTEAFVTLVGSPQALGRLEPTELAIVIDLSDAGVGANPVAIVDGAMELPSGVSLYNANPPVLSVNVRSNRVPEAAAPAP